MCGIAGYIKVGRNNSQDISFLSWFHEQLQHIKQRGIDAAGIVWISEQIDMDGAPWTYQKEIELGNAFEILSHRPGPRPGERIIGCLINFRNIPVTEYFGHLEADQVQPFIDAHGQAIVAHNGQLANDKQLAAEHGWQRMASSGSHDIDSYAFLQLWSDNKQPSGYYYHDLPSLFSELEGSWAAALVDLQLKHLVLTRTFLGLDIAVVESHDNMYLAWGSTLKPLHEITGAGYHVQRAEIAELPPHTLVCLDLPSFIASHSSADAPYNTSSGMLRSILRGGGAHLLDRNRLLPISCIAVVASGGMDSTVALTMACQTYKEVHVLHFDYGAKASVPEFIALRDIIDWLHARYPAVKLHPQIIDLSFLKDLGGSALTEDKLSITKGEYAAETASEWVPARNTVLMAMAAAYCDRHQLQGIMLGLNREESATHCDNSSEYFTAFEKALELGTKSRPKMLMPLAEMMKHHIVKKGIEINAPLHLSWSCYDAKRSAEPYPGAYQGPDVDMHFIRCGSCGSCLLRRRAYAMNGQRDPLPYLADDPVAESILRQSAQSCN